MNLPDLAREFFEIIEREIGPFDRPLRFRPFPFQAGGALNFLTIGYGRNKFITYVSWDLFGHKEQKRGKLGRYEFLISCDDEDWVLKVVTNIGRQSLRRVFDAGDTLDIGPWVGTDAKLQGVVFAEAIEIRMQKRFCNERCGLMRCIGVTRSELEFAAVRGVPLLLDYLRHADIYPNTIVNRDSVYLPE